MDQNEAEIWHLLGTLYLDQNQLDEAEGALKKSFEIYSSLPGEYRAELADILNGQALIHRLHADLAGAIALSRRGLELTRASLGEKNPAVANPLDCSPSSCSKPADSARRKKPSGNP